MGTLRAYLFTPLLPMIPVPAKLRSQPIAELLLSAGLRRALRRLGVIRLGDLRYFSAQELDPTCGQRVDLVTEIASLIPQTRALLAALEAAKPAGERAVDRAAPFSVAPSARDLKLVELPVPLRPSKLLKRQGFERLGQLDGQPAGSLLSQGKCGLKSVQAISAVIEQANRGDFQGVRGAAWRAANPLRAEAVPLAVAARARELRLAELPISIRLGNVLHKLGFERLGQLDGVRGNTILERKNCGVRTVNELRALIERANRGDFELKEPGRVRWFAQLAEEVLAQVRPRDRLVLGLRYGATEEEALTLEGTAQHIGRTRERVRQMTARLLAPLRRRCRGSLAPRVREILTACTEAVIPLTPELWVRWAQAEGCRLEYRPAFYLRLLAEAAPDLPIWPHGQRVANRPGPRHLLIVEETVAAVAAHPDQPSFKEAFQRVRARGKVPRLTALEFLHTLALTKRPAVLLDDPERPCLLPVRRGAIPLLQAVLEASDRPLTPEQMMERLRDTSSDLHEWSPKYLVNELSLREGFYLLGPRSFGLRKHFRLPEAQWPAIRADFQACLEQEKRPVATGELIREKRFAWTELTSSHELAQIMREAPEFADLGRGLFGLRAWGEQRRELLKPLMLKILTDTGLPHTARQLARELRKHRSVSQTTVPVLLRQIKEVRAVGFGFFGLSTWGPRALGRLLDSRVLAQRLLSRNPPPLTFARACQLLGVPTAGPEARLLWHTFSTMTMVVCAPRQMAPDAVLLHLLFPLEKALLNTARAAARPLTAEELEQLVRVRFKGRFDWNLPTRIATCLEHGKHFHRDAEGKYLPLSGSSSQFDPDRLKAGLQTPPSAAESRLESRL